MYEALQRMALRDHEAEYRRTVVYAQAERRAAVERERQLQRRARPRREAPGRRRALVVWLGGRLVRLGERLRSPATA